MYIAPDKLSLLCFPQHWEAGTLELRVVCLPRGNPMLSLIGSGSPAFKDAELQLEAKIIPSLDRLPNPADGTATIALSTPHPPNAAALFGSLAAQFDIDPAIEAATDNPRRAGRAIKKLLVPSYIGAFAFSTPRTPYAVLDDSYACALRNPCRLKKTPGSPPSRKVSWGRVIAMAMRQPMVAEQLGLIYSVSVTLADPETFVDGGWAYITLQSTDAYAPHVTANPDLLRTYAARIPPLTGDPRGLFAAVLFPVSTTPPTGNFDELFDEAVSYDDGFAKIVHCAQAHTADSVGLETPSSLRPVIDTGMQIGCDDEQQLIWMNRQIADPAVETRDSPMSIAGFRIDVRQVGTTIWTTLMRAQARLVVGTIEVGDFDGELKVQAAPVQLDDEADGEYWLSTYLAEWQGWSLVSTDPLSLRVSGVTGPALTQPYTPVGPLDVLLRYGNSYEFRVRLVDISGGGPLVGDEPSNPAPAPVARCDFRRHLPPGHVIIEDQPAPVDPLNPPTVLKISRPRLGYPAAIFAGIPSNARQALQDDVASITGSGRVPGLPDPDVTMVSITVQVAGLDLDNANDREGSPPLRTVYTTTREFPANPAQQLEVPLAYQDVVDVATLSAPATGALPIPTARNVVITVRALGKLDPSLNYFGSQQARVGPPTDVPVRRAPLDETGLFVDDTPGNRFRAIMLQSDDKQSPSLVAQLAASGRGEEAQTNLVQRLAEELNFDVSGLMLTGRPGHRIIFGCSKAIPHTLSPDRSSITFGSKADLVNHWISVLSLGIKRDWTWDGLNAISVVRQGVGKAGSIELPRVINPLVLKNPQRSPQLPDRSTTQLMFFDAVDPKPEAPQFPQELDVTYELTPSFRNAPGAQDDPLQLTIHLPVAVSPTQTPKLASAGVALSQYQRSEDYSSTAAREQVLWFEFEETVENPTDAYFVRMLSYSPDPMLTNGQEVTLPAEPPLPIDPEHIRVIRPGQSDDGAGLTAMQGLIPTDSRRHFIIPLPPGIDANSLELFGFFVHEIRVGHYADVSTSPPNYVWSTAQGRFGPALRVTGVQHPRPVLLCHVQHTTDGILASAEYATPVFEGRKMLPTPPATDMWVLLYAQVSQVDGGDRRNILLSHRAARITHDRHTGAQTRGLVGFTGWTHYEIGQALNALALKPDSPLSVLAVECLPEADRLPDPLGRNLGNVRILRTSPLVPVPAICEHPPCPPS